MRPTYLWRWCDSKEVSVVIWWHRLINGNVSVSEPLTLAYLWQWHEGTDLSMMMWHYNNDVMVLTYLWWWCDVAIMSVQTGPHHLCHTGTLEGSLQGGARRRTGERSLPERAWHRNLSCHQPKGKQPSPLRNHAKVLYRAFSQCDYKISYKPLIISL